MYQMYQETEIMFIVKIFEIEVQLNNEKLHYC